MFVRFTNNKGQKTDFGFTAQFDFKPTGLDQRDVEVKTLAELQQKFAAYCAEADATGVALVVTFHQSTRDRSRKINGFDKLAHATKHFTPAAALPAAE
jgi:hypothetical protein